MPGLLPDLDPEGLLEYSVVFTDRSLNHMSAKFQQIMNDISSNLKNVYNASAVAIIPGGGTFAMEAVARQLATNQQCLVLRNGFFSYRWSQIIETGNITHDHQVLKARQIADETTAPYMPPPIDTVVDAILTQKPAIVFAPHVETASGILLPDDYLRTVAEAVHSIGGLFVLDAIASGTLWVDMEANGIDVLISSTQKGWSSSPCSGFVMLNDRAIERVEQTTSTSFACDLGKWLQIMRAYETGGHAYHATMPTDSLAAFSETVNEMQAYGFAKLKQEQIELGKQVREMLEGLGYKSVALEGYKAPGVIVSYTNDSEVQSGKKFLTSGIQVAAGVPLLCDEREDFRTFRVGLFGLDKLHHTERTVSLLRQAIEIST